MILVPANKVEKIKYFSSLLGLIFIEITRGPFVQFSRQNTSLDTFLTKTWKNGKMENEMLSTKRVSLCKSLWEIGCELFKKGFIG